MKEYKVNINGITYSVSVEEVGKSKSESNTIHEVVSANSIKNKKTLDTQVENLNSKEERPAPIVNAHQGGEDYAIVSPLPGIVFDILVRVGDKITAGQKIVVVEAMKMENDIEADRDGIVKQIPVSKGDSVYEGDTLIVLSV